MWYALSVRTLTEQLGNYAAYHRDRRNIAVHCIGIPLITVAVAILLSRPMLTVGGMLLSPAVIVSVAAIVFYFRLDVRYGLAMSAVLVTSVGIGMWLAAGPTSLWLGVGFGLFVVGWIFQLVGHAWEGRKPAFVDDLVGLLVGPLFIVAEAGFALGLRTDVRDAIERQAGPTRAGPVTVPDPSSVGSPARRR